MHYSISITRVFSPPTYMFVIIHVVLKTAGKTVRDSKTGRAHAPIAVCKGTFLLRPAFDIGVGRGGGGGQGGQPPPPPPPQ